eukprot:GHVR01020109.1.p1 GENE.GHVR01020109.1~~GHVR01020109.1.p1  ORF type:complete len:100 (-),score=38.46 GHVR01020109.1:360-617(-)
MERIIQRDFPRAIKTHIWRNWGQSLDRYNPNILKIFIDYRDSVANVSDMLKYYNISNKKDDIRDVERAAKTVGLQLPLLHKEGDI